MREEGGRDEETGRGGEKSKISSLFTVHSLLLTPHASLKLGGGYSLSDPGGCVSGFAGGESPGFAF